MGKITTCLFCFLLGNALHSQNFYQEVSAAANLPSRPRAGSLAVGDFNNDGYEDLYISYSLGKNHLCKNNGDGTFTEMANMAGVDFQGQTKSAVWGDLDNDGDLDLYLANKDFPDVLYRNDGNETFTDITFEAGINNLAYPLSVNLGDLNGDGFLDIYIANILQENVLYLNNGDFTFTDFTLQSGALDQLSAMGVIIFDYDQDGDQDLYLTHDANHPNILYENDGSAHFTDVSAQAGVNTASNAMGVDIGDFDNDGDSDIYIANLYENILLKNNGNGTFSDISQTANIDDDGMGWGVSFLDYDNDGLLDIYVANDSEFSPKPNILYKNLGNETFSKAETTGSVSSMRAGYSTVAFDYNMDGQQDLAVANKGGSDHIELFKNPMRNGNWIGFKLLGIQSNRNAIGVKIRLKDSKNRIYFKEMTAGSGWVSQNSGLFHFGLGSENVSEINIEWPSGLVQNLTPVAVNQYYTIVEGQTPQIGIHFDVSTHTNHPNSPKVNVHPNPSSGDFYIYCHLPNQDNCNIQIFNQNGILVFEEKQPKFESLVGKKITLPNGIYFLKTTNGVQSDVQKIIVYRFQ